jgi:hypothetical protein
VHVKNKKKIKYVFFVGVHCTVWSSPHMTIAHLMSLPPKPIRKPNSIRMSVAACFGSYKKVCARKVFYRLRRRENHTVHCAALVSGERKKLRFFVWFKLSETTSFLKFINMFKTISSLILLFCTSSLIPISLLIY